MVLRRGHPAPFLLEDPFAAGAAAVVTNVSDVRAMGGRPLGVVDMLVAPDRAHAETVLDGIAWAGDKLGVPVVGGHPRSGMGRRSRLSTGSRGARCAPPRLGLGDVLIAAFATDGRYMSEARPFFTALHDRAPALRTDGEALVEVAERCAMPLATSRCPGSPARSCR